MIENCPVCGNGFEILWPHLWAYKRNGQYICSWKCLRENEKRTGVNEMSGKSKVPDEAKKKAIQAAIDGNDPYEYLKPYTENPKSMWTYIKMMVKQKDPELYEKIPDLRELKKVKQNLADAIDQVPDHVPEQIVKGPVTPDELYEKLYETFKRPEEPKICQPVVYEDMVVREVEGLFGRYRRSDIGQETYIDLEFTDSCDVISNTAGQWRSFIAELDKATKILGVEL